ncbi:hypothetical protein Dimus_003312, partial [Dionaea muscipula]
RCIIAADGPPSFNDGPRFDAAVGRWQAAGCCAISGLHVDENGIHMMMAASYCPLHFCAGSCFHSNARVRGPLHAAS